MAKTLNELAGELRALIIELNSDAHNRVNFRAERYNNLKLSMDVAKEKIPHITISVGMSEGTYNINNFEKMNGSLGVDEKYVQRWFSKQGVADNLKAAWKLRIENRGKVTDVE